MKVRQDAWSHEDDLLLAETVLRHIREGSTQLNAFEEVGDKLNRTSAACGFRWNAEVRQKYIQAMEIAKKQRKERKRALAQQSPQLSQEPVKREFSITEDKPTGTNYYAPPQQSVNRQVETPVESDNNQISFDMVITYLQSVRNYGFNSQIIQSENSRLTRENSQLKNEKERLEKKLQRLKEQNSIVQEDYQALVQIMDRARRLVTPNDFSINPNEELGQIAK